MRETGIPQIQRGFGIPICGGRNGNRSYGTGLLGLALHIQAVRPGNIGHLWAQWNLALALSIECIDHHFTFLFSSTEDTLLSPVSLGK